MKPKHARPATKADETPEFIEFWKLWSETKSQYDARALARDAFFRHVWWRDADPSDILDAARWYVRNHRPGEFRLLASNWLDRGFYEDDAEKERAYQQRLSEREQQRSANVVSISAPKSKWLQQFEAEKQQKQA